jgi:hypothetical protein
MGAKVRFAGGGPQAGHSSLTIERVVPDAH